MASTHTELYRRYAGELVARRMRFWPMVASGVRVGVKKKLPLLLLYTPVVITTIVYSFVVYGKYAAEDVAATMGGPRGLAAMFAQRAALHIDVAEKIMGANVVLRMFALLITAWFGAGLLAEDRRLGAHLLYFARPLTRVDYFLGKFLTAGTFAAFASLVPGLVICLFAAWCSPDWEFLKQEGNVLWKSIVFSCLWILTTTSVVLAFSALVRRKTLALVGTFGFFVLFHVLAKVLSTIDKRYQFVSLFDSLQRAGNWIFGIDNPWENQVPLGAAFGMMAGLIAVSLGIVALRLRRMEVVA
jgi:ABC-type transport system involved in multi-copper enzyme maturation permease subunit